jgi:hypothetical protein
LTTVTDDYKEIANRLKQARCPQHAIERHIEALKVARQKRLTPKPKDEPYQHVVYDVDWDR